MAANYRTCAFAGFPALALASPGLGVRLAALGSKLTALLNGCRLLQPAIRTGHGGPAGGGSEKQPGEHPTSGSIWDDPQLWILMMH